MAGACGRCLVAACLIGIATLLGAACSDGSGRFSLPTPLVGPSPSQSSGSPVVREITLGQAVSDDANTATHNCTTNPRGLPVPCRFYVFTAPADGTVTATLAWDWWSTSALLMLRLDGTDTWPSDMPPTAVSRELQVVAGRRYSLEVGLDPDFSGGGEAPYVLTTALK